MRGVRGATALVVAGALGGLVLTGPAGPATAAPSASVTVNPATASPGSQVTVTGNCGDGVAQATVASAAFPNPVTLAPAGGVLTGTATIPVGTVAQGYSVTLTCPGGATATTTLWVVSVAASIQATASPSPSPSASPSPSLSAAAILPSQGPATGAGGMAGTGAWLILIGGLTALLAGGGMGLLALAGRSADARPGAHRRRAPAGR
jgi:hypothetical protein